MMNSHVTKSNRVHSVLFATCEFFVFVGVFLQNVFGINAESVNVFEIYTWINITNPSLFLIVNLVYYLISLIFVYLSYKNKEKIIMLCEV